MYSTSTTFEQSTAGAEYAQRSRIMGGKDRDLSTGMCILLTRLLAFICPLPGDLAGSSCNTQLDLPERLTSSLICIVCDVDSIPNGFHFFP